MRPAMFAAALSLLAAAGCAPDPALYDLFYYGPLEPLGEVGGGGPGTGGDGGSGGEAGTGGEAVAPGDGGAGGHGGAGGAGGEAGGGGGASTSSTSTGVVEPQCKTAADCFLVPSECRWPTCIEGRCGIETLGLGTPVEDDVEGDCARRICNDSGGVTTVYDRTDAPFAPNSCRRAECTRDGAVWTNGPAGIQCEEPGKECDGKGNCVPVTPGRTPTE